MNFVYLILFTLFALPINQNHYEIKLRDLTLTRDGKLIQFDEKVGDVLKTWGTPTKIYREMDEDLGVNTDVLQYGLDRLYFYDGQMGAFQILSSMIMVTPKLLKVGQALPNGLVYEMEKSVLTSEVVDDLL